MSRGVVVLALFSLLVVGATANDCTTGTLPDNETATLNYFSGNVTVNGSKVTISACDTLETFPGCGASTGYLATYAADGACDVVYNRKDNTTYNYTLKQFRTRYYTDNSQFDAMQELFVIVSCLVGADIPSGSREGDVITFRSETVCPGYTPTSPPTPAPTEAEKEGLSTGAIVGIVIGALAILIIVLVIFRWKAQKGEEEGEYQRV